MNSAELIANLSPTPAAYLKAARALEGMAEHALRPVRVAVLSTFTAEFLRPYLTVAGASRGLRIQSWFAPWGQIEQQVLDPSSELYAQQPHVIFALARIEELLPSVAGRFLAATEAEQNEAIEEVRLRFDALLQSARAHTNCPVFFSNFLPPQRPAAGLADVGLEHSESAWVGRCNAVLGEVCRAHSDAFVFDLARVAVDHGLRCWTDPKLFHLARVPMSTTAQIATAHGLARAVRAALTPAAKVLVLDLDNTLWGGILGEAGVGGIALGDEYPGNVFKAFHHYLLTLKDRGVLLAVATKNNPADVQELWDTHPDCLLRPDDFAAIRVNWQEKSTNLREIAAELNVGVDSLVFFDDSPFERAEVKRHLPAVTVLEVPESPLGYVDAIEESGVFDRLALSREDRLRASYYQQQAARAAVQGTSSSPEEFLHSLAMVATIGAIGPETLPRVAQLLAKTNQFNLTTRRHTAAEISAILDAGGVGLWLRLQDRFGDTGLVGVALALPETSERWRIDTFLLSCRVIGRSAETLLLAELASRVADRGAKKLMGEYLPTAKNGLVAEFYARHGFVDEGSGRWLYAMGKHPLACPPFFTVRYAS